MKPPVSKREELERRWKVGVGPHWVQRDRGGNPRAVLSSTTDTRHDLELTRNACKHTHRTRSYPLVSLIPPTRLRCLGPPQLLSRFRQPKQLNDGADAVPTFRPCRSTRVLIVPHPLAATELCKGTADVCFFSSSTNATLNRPYPYHARPEPQVHLDRSPQVSYTG